MDFDGAGEISQFAQLLFGDDDDQGIQYLADLLALYLQGQSYDELLEHTTDLDTGGLERDTFFHLLMLSGTLPPDMPGADPPLSERLHGTTPQEMDLILAHLADHVYPGKNPDLPEGWEVVSPGFLEAAGFDTDLLHDADTGFDAGVYRGPDGEYVVAFAGTDQGVKDPWHGWLQSTGLYTAQYAQAGELAAEAREVFGDNLAWAGHSMGGGLASYAAMETGNPAVTFNAQGVSRRTIADGGWIDAVWSSRDEVQGALDQAAAGQIRSYSMTSDILTNAQMVPMFPGVSLPEAPGHQIILSDTSRRLGFIPKPVSMHMMDSVLEAMEELFESSDPGPSLNEVLERREFLGRLDPSDPESELFDQWVRDQFIRGGSWDR